MTLVLLELTIQNYGFRSANHETDASSDEKPILILGYLNRTRAIFVIVTHMIDATAHGIQRISLASYGFNRPVIAATSCIPGSSQRS